MVRLRREIATTSPFQEFEPGCSSQEVMTQLRVILSHEMFSNSPVLSNFLKFIVEETLAGNLNSLKEYTIGVSGLGKKSDFDPQMDAIVRIHAGRLRRLIAEYYAGPGIQDEISIEVAKGSYVPVFRRRPLKAKSSNALFPLKTEPKHVEISKIMVAILPFRNLCEFRDKQFFVDGLGEEFTRVFSTSQEFAVIGHHSTLKLFLQKASLQTIGLKLHVQYVITGAVMLSQNHLRVNIGLTETNTSTQIWSKLFDHESDSDLLGVQRQVAEAVYALLGGQVGFIVSHSLRVGYSPSLA